MATVTETPMETRLTIDEFVKRFDQGPPVELVRGKVIPLSPPKPYHGFVCLNAAAILREYVKAHELGYVLSNDSGVVTGRNPDTLRGADIAFYSHAKVPKGSLQPGGPYLEVVPDLVVEVRSPSDGWPAILEKVADSLNAGVPVVAVLDPEFRNLQVDSVDAPVRLIEEDQPWSLPEILPGFAENVRRFFE